MSEHILMKPEQGASNLYSVPTELRESFCKHVQKRQIKSLEVPHNGAGRKHSPRREDGRIVSRASNVDITF